MAHHKSQRYIIITSPIPKRIVVCHYIGSHVFIVGFGTYAVICCCRDKTCDPCIAFVCELEGVSLGYVYVVLFLSYNLIHTHIIIQHPRKSQDPLPLQLYPKESVGAVHILGPVIWYWRGGCAYLFYVSGPRSL